MKYKILIVGTVPYNEKTTSRAFASYFTGIPRENLAQIFSNPKTPIKGHCATLYQITDQRLLYRRIHKHIDTGRIFWYDELDSEWKDNELEVNSRIMSKMYRLGKKKNALMYLIRKIIWKRKYWCTEKLNSWLESFNPNCVFLSFSDDFFIPQIALYVAEKFKIPIISSIGDDYYFNYNFSISPLYHIYKLMYRALIRRVFRHDGSAIYIGEKIKDKYNFVFGLKGETVYLTSSIKRREFKAIKRNTPIISYFGNIRLGRNRSLIDIATALGKINPEFKIDIYSNESDPKYYRMFKEHPNTVFHGSIAYSEVQKRTIESDILLVVEGFRKKDVSLSRYSLSTKVADALASGVAVLAYGSSECGAIEYAKKTGAIATCTKKEDLENIIIKLLGDKTYQKELYDRSISVTENNHFLSKSTKIFQNVVNRVCEGYKNVKE